MNEQSVYGRPVTDHKPLRRGVWFWIVLGVLALPVLAISAVVVWFVASDDPFDTSPDAIDCAEALVAADLETLPQGAEPACAEGGFQDPYLTIDFVAHEADVDVWLRSELPATELEHGDACFESDGCLQVSYGEPDAPESGWTLDIKTVDQSDGMVAVTVGAYSL